jgi:hypothetical protein
VTEARPCIGDGRPATTHGDNEVEVKWRGYAATCTGLCIVVNRQGYKAF